VTKRKTCSHTHTTRKNIQSSFLIRRMVGEGDPFYPKFRAELTLYEENAYFQSIFAHSASAVTSGQKKSATNRKSHMGCQLVQTSATLSDLKRSFCDS